MEWTLFADLADVAGDRRVAVEVGTDATVDEALTALLEARPALRDRVLEESGELRGHLTILRNGEEIAPDADVALDPEDELALMPPVSGG